MRPRAASITRTTTARASESRRPSQTKTRGPSGVVRMTLWICGCKDKLNAPKMAKKMTNWMKAKKRFFMGVLCMLSPASASSLAVVVERQFSWDFDIQAVDAGRGGDVNRPAILGEAQVG